MRSDAMDLIPEYVLGTLPEAEMREIEALVAESPSLRREVERVTEALVQSADALEPIAPPESLRARLVKTLTGPDRFEPFFATLSRLADLPLEGLRKVLTTIDEAAGWEPGPLPTIQIIHFAAGPRAFGADAGFLRL